jgi:hypothetical protein
MDGGAAGSVSAGCPATTAVQCSASLQCTALPPACAHWPGASPAAGESLTMRPLLMMRWEHPALRPAGGSPSVQKHGRPFSAMVVGRHGIVVTGAPWPGLSRQGEMTPRHAVGASGPQAAGGSPRLTIPD